MREWLLRAARSLMACMAGFFLVQSPVMADTGRVDSYVVNLGGLRLLRAEIRVGPVSGDRPLFSVVPETAVAMPSIDGAVGLAAATVRAGGILGWLFPGEAHAEVGLAAPAGPNPAPLAFVASGRFGSAPQTVTMVHGPVLEIEANPPLRVRDYDALPETLVGALDPLSAAVSLSAAPSVEVACGRTVPVFDSRRRFDLVLAPAVADGDRWRCEGVFRRVSGYKVKHRESPDHPFTAWFVEEGGFVRFDRAQAMTSLGYAVIRRDR